MSRVLTPVGRPGRPGTIVWLTRSDGTLIPTVFSAVTSTYTYWSVASPPIVQVVGVVAVDDVWGGTFTAHWLSTAPPVAASYARATYE